VVWSAAATYAVIPFGVHQTVLVVILGSAGCGSRTIAALFGCKLPHGYLGS